MTTCKEGPPVKLTPKHLSPGIAILAIFSVILIANASEILGRKPRYLLSGTSSVPNEQSMNTIEREPSKKIRQSLSFRFQGSLRVWLLTAEEVSG